MKKKCRGKGKKLVVFVIEKRAKGISRMYDKAIEKADVKNFSSFMKDTIESKANIKTENVYA